MIYQGKGSLNRPNGKQVYYGYYEKVEGEIENIEEKLCGNMENIGKKCNNCVLDDCAGDGVALYHIAIFFHFRFFPDFVLLFRIF